ncbi:MAG: hypothetical protein V3V24_00245, partial [Nitrospinaceae bacterium]
MKHPNPAAHNASIQFCIGGGRLGTFNELHCNDYLIDSALISREFIQNPKAISYLKFAAREL